MGGERTALEWLLARVREFAVANALGSLGDPDAADDVAQEVTTIVWRRISGLRVDTALRSWLWTLTLNAVRGHIRRTGSHRRGIDALETQAERARLPGLLERLAQREAIAGVEAQATTLPRAQRSALRLVAFEGLTAAQAAAELGVSTKTVSANLCRARAAIRQG